MTTRICPKCHFATMRPGPKFWFCDRRECGYEAQMLAVYDYGEGGAQPLQPIPTCPGCPGTDHVHVDGCRYAGTKMATPTTETGRLRKALADMESQRDQYKRRIDRAIRILEGF